VTRRNFITLLCAQQGVAACVIGALAYKIAYWFEGW
jgi:hypothetical protein